MSRCKGCGKDFRRGRRRSLLQIDGTLASAIVCPSCASRCLQVLAPAFYVPPRELVIDGNETLAAVRTRLKVYMKATEHEWAKSGPGSEAYAYNRGKVEGIDQAIELLTAALEGRV